jgi:hypothetical protein
MTAEAFLTTLTLEGAARRGGAYTVAATKMSSQRRADLIRFYSILETLEQIIGGASLRTSVD